MTGRAREFGPVPGVGRTVPKVLWWSRPEAGFSRKAASDRPKEGCGIGVVAKRCAMDRLFRAPLGPFLVLVGLSSCYEAGSSSWETGELYPPTGADEPFVPVSTAAELNAALGQSETLLVGLGNDLPGDGSTARSLLLNEPPPLHYVYLVGLSGPDGWTHWNPDGAFLTRQARAALDKGVVPVFTLYAMADWGEARLDVLTDPSYMGPWWDGYALALRRLGELHAPAMLHVEPDFWGFAQQRGDGDPTEIEVLVGSVYPPCAHLPDTLAGFGQCVVEQARTWSPLTRIGFHASRWAHDDPAAIADFLLQAGAGDADALFVETLDRDAGCFEARGEGCTRDDGPWYWDDSGQGTPGFRTHLADMKALHEATGLPLVWWQMPMGVPSAASGGQPMQYRDNRVAYFFAHPEEFAEAGGAAVMFGPGWPGQTDLTSDGGQFLRYWKSYRSAPVVLSGE